MSVHIGPPQIWNYPTIGPFVAPNQSTFGSVGGTFVIDPLIANSSQTLVLSSANTSALGRPKTFNAVLWGSGGSGGGSVVGNPAGDLIGGAGGAGLSYKVVVILAAPPIPASCSIVFAVTAGCGSISFVDTNATLSSGGSATATKTITALPGQGGISATYSVGQHSAGRGGYGGGQAPGQYPVSITLDDSASFISTPPNGFSAWHFNTSDVQSITVTPIVGNSGVSGLQGAVWTGPPTFLLPPNQSATTVPTDLTQANGDSVGLFAGAGGAGCGSSAVLSPGTGGNGFVFITAY